MILEIVWVVKRILLPWFNVHLSSGALQWSQWLLPNNNCNFHGWFFWIDRFILKFIDFRLFYNLFFRKVVFTPKYRRKNSRNFHTVICQVFVFNIISLLMFVIVDFVYQVPSQLSKSLLSPSAYFSISSLPALLLCI